MIYFISGQEDLTLEEFNNHYKDLIIKIIESDKNSHFILGDNLGCDKIAMDFITPYLISDKTKLTIYHTSNSPKNKPYCNVLRNLKYKGDYNCDLEKDSDMTNISDFDIIWIRPNTLNNKSKQNIKRRYGI